MVAITLPDGSVRSYDGPVSAAEIAASIGPGLAKAAVIALVDGEEWDLTRTIETDAAVALVTRDDDKALEVIRHDCSHVMAKAVQELYPGTQVTIGPAIEDGFYYDFARDEPFTPEDFERIEKRMHEIVDVDEAFEREVWDRDEAAARFVGMGENYKAILIERIPEGEPVSIYKTGDWFDLCRGPHLPSTKAIGHAFKLMKVAGAYFLGDHRQPMLQRIYGTAWRTEKELKAYLHRLEEAERRDHRRLGRELHLFHFQEEAIGSVFWHPKGWTLYRTVERYMRSRLDQAGYEEVKTPILLDRVLWERSGHWEKFREHMFLAEDEHDRMLALKPMNCPAHVQIFKQGIVSYRDLPMRMAEFGSCHRNEPSGALHGLMRVRSFIQDDAHIFCTEDQIVQETKNVCELLMSVYKAFGFEDVIVKFADRPPVRAGDDATWDRAEEALMVATKAAGLEFQLNPGEGAFYGPKLEFVLRDAIGREWQCGTHQVDFVLPERLDATYIDEHGEKRRPAMLHRAIVGSFERFLGILIEHYEGKFPMWLAPRQVVVATITSDADDYARGVLGKLEAAGLRAEADLRNEKINYKVREHSVKKVPALFVVGKREADDETVALRRLGGKAQEILALDNAISMLKSEAAMPGAD